MSLEDTITDITRRLREGRFPNEQAISQGIVLRILLTATHVIASRHTTTQYKNTAHQTIGLGSL